MNLNEIEKMIENSDMILIGIGEEFEAGIDFLKQSAAYEIFSQKLKQENLDEEQYIWMYPYLLKMACEENLEQNVIWKSYLTLQQLVKNKNCFVVTMNMDGLIYETGWERERIVAPFGNYRFYQCNNGCQDKLWEDVDTVSSIIDMLLDERVSLSKIKQPVCEYCGEKIVFNTVNADKYLESGYLEDWSVYTKWLQGTLNRNVCILELGVMLNYPSVIRWPFEKMAYFNQKSSFVRINSKFPQLTDEIKDRGVSIKENPVSFFANGIVS